MYDWIIANRELLKIVYGLIIGLICLKIVLRTDKLFKLSLHQGIRYFRNAFFFYGIAFIIRYIFGSALLFEQLKLNYYPLITSLFEFFLIMGGFSLFYSLVWKKFERKKESVSSLFNMKIMVLYVIAIILVIFDYSWRTYNFLFISQIVLFACASIISYVNYAKARTKARGDIRRQYNFLKLYFIVMILNFIAWEFNFIVSYFLGWNKAGIANIHLLNIIIFLLFLYGVNKVTKR